MTEPTTTGNQPVLHDLHLTLNADQQLRAQERLRSLLISQPWYAAQDACYALEFWRSLLFSILSDPATELEDGTPITPMSRQEGARVWLGSRPGARGMGTVAALAGRT